MNQQTLTTDRSASPAARAADGLAWLDEQQAGQWNAREISADAEICAQALMATNIEKILLLTRLSWAAAYADKQLPRKIRR